MTQPEFYNIVNMNDILVSIPQCSHFTIGTSPYYAHQHGLGIDIYQSLALENYEAFSPISGTILMAKQLIAPKPKFLGGIDKDYLILVSNTNNPNITYKILHIKPEVKVGEKISIGNSLGKTIRNGYFATWSSPHLHLEIRHNHDAIRASGGIPFSLGIKNKLQNKITEPKETYQFPFKIYSINSEFILGTFPKNLYFNINHIYGVMGAINGIKCIIDGGIPHYKNGTIIYTHQMNLKEGDPIYLGTQIIGKIVEFREQFGFLKFERNIKFFLDDDEIRGISLFLANSIPLIKIIPFKEQPPNIYEKSSSVLSICSS
ncbi:hypothetical protein LCGC14_0816720 [marine sediment metagenome]|uniref:DUF8155 domain-containing protein n=1 Tax=marine sediment metagenome TaxID=412755 RepID=A0A0F9PJX8_9ZZZZ|nr:MAG: Peptidase family M23 [Candidatus Lokiarchaeum sp. GC14_75]